MSVVVAHQQSATSRLVLQAAAHEASLRSTNLSVIHISEAVDVDIATEQEKIVRGEIARALDDASLNDLDWSLSVDTGADVAEAILDLLADADAELVVIGARRRTPVGKMLMGSVTQTLILRAEVPVLVVKSPARA